MGDDRGRRVSDAYAELAALAERRRDLAADGLIEELAAADADFERLIAGLPPTPPPSAQPYLERALALGEELVATLRAEHAAVARELGHLRRGRTTARGYAQGGEPAPRLVDRAG
jgi:hypothetical protein